MKLRLLVTKECQRSCVGCCTKDRGAAKPQRLSALPEWFTDKLKLVMITGGEPLLFPVQLSCLISQIKSYTKAKVIVCTAAIEEGLLLSTVIQLADGVTLTLRTQADADMFMTWSQVTKLPRDKMLRLNVFEGVKVRASRRWRVKWGMRWVKNCLLPKGETFARINRPWSHKTNPFRAVAWAGNHSWEAE